MGTRTFNILVVIFWVCAVSWLIKEKVVPELRRGTPPDYLSLGSDQASREPVVCWTIELVDIRQNPSRAAERLGWAASRVVPRTAGRSELQSRVQLWRVPLSSLGGPVLRGALGLAGIHENLELGVNSSLHLDNQSKLSRFQSSVMIGDGPTWCTITGINHQGQLDVSAQLGKNGRQHFGSYWLGDESMVGDGNAPNGYMPNLSLGQSWKTRQLSALKPGVGIDGSSEELEATVVRREEIVWDSHGESCWLVEFRPDAGAGTRFVDHPQRQIWVRPSDGKVLREEIQILNRRLRFVRLPPAQAKQFAAVLEKDWSARIDENVMPR
jgi:hypothetical protein